MAAPYDLFNYRFNAKKRGLIDFADQIPLANCPLKGDWCRKDWREGWAEGFMMAVNEMKKHQHVERKSED